MLIFGGPPPSAAVAPQETAPVPRAHLGPTLEGDGGGGGEGEGGSEGVADDEVLMTPLPAIPIGTRVSHPSRGVGEIVEQKRVRQLGDIHASTVLALP